MSFNFLIMLVAAVVIVVLLNKRRSERPLEQGQSAPDTRRERELEAEIAELKERIKVLERIAYDDRKRVGLADEIESLRD